MSSVIAGEGLPDWSGYPAEGLWAAVRRSSNEKPGLQLKSVVQPKALIYKQLAAPYCNK